MPTFKYVTLEVMGPPAAELGPDAVHTFGVKGGRIGRAADNDWVVNNPYISRYQASIGFANGRFHLAADSQASAAMFINGQDSQLRAPQKYPLSSGDQITIDEIRIEVSLSAELPAPPGMTDEPEASEGHSFREASPPVAPNGDRPDANPFGGGDRQVTDPPWDPGEIAETAERYSPLSDNLPPPKPESESVCQIPAGNWWEDPQRDARHESQPALTGVAETAPRRVTAKPSRGSEAESDLAAFLKGLGIDDATLTPEVMSELGAIVRVVVQGVVDMLRARDEIRTGFRIPVTHAQSKENNPLKLAPNAESALRSLLVKYDDAYLPALASFEQAFDDLRAHQMAMLKGMRAGYENMLARFDPDKLEPRFESQSKAAAFAALGGRSRLWDQYRNWFKETTEDEQDCFRRLFGDVFGKAYEEELCDPAYRGSKRYPTE
jgi:type VI secretion system protein ImpI